MQQYTVAVIPGDGVGKEVIPEGLRAIRAAAAGHGELRDHDRRVPVVVRVVSRARLDDARRRPRPAPRTSTRSISGPSASPACRTTSPCGACCSRSGRASTSTSTCAPCACSTGFPGRFVIAGRPTSTSSASARTPRASTRGSAAGSRAGTPDEVVDPDVALHPAGDRTGHPLRLRAGEEPAPPACERHEVERAELLDGVLGRGHQCGRGRLPRCRGDDDATSTRSRRGSSWPPKTSMSSSPATCSATSSPTSAGHSRGPSGCPPRRTSIPRSATRACSSRSTGRRPAAPGKAWPTRWPPSGPR